MLAVLFVALSSYVWNPISGGGFGSSFGWPLGYLHEYRMPTAMVGVANGLVNYSYSETQVRFTFMTFLVNVALTSMAFYWLAWNPRYAPRLEASDHPEILLMVRLLRHVFSHRCEATISFPADEAAPVVVSSQRESFEDDLIVRGDALWKFICDCARSSEPIVDHLTTSLSVHLAEYPSFTCIATIDPSMRTIRLIPHEGSSCD